MFRLHIDNALSDKIGKAHGLDPAVFKKFLRQKAPLVREVFRQKSKSGYAFLTLPEDQALVRKIQKFVRGQKKRQWENIAILGIGGSALGTIALQEALLGSYNILTNRSRLFVLDNIDPDLLGDFFRVADIRKTLFIVISKSGGTVETMAQFYLIQRELEKKKIKNWREHFVLITDPKEGLLRELGNKEKITMFEVPPKIGGRFSVLSAVGLVPAALAGIDIGGLLKGAKKMVNLLEKSKPEINPALVLSALQYLLDTQKKKAMTVMMPYSNRLFRLGDWYRQLLAESIGKNSKTGPTPINALGTTDQHSQLQLYNEGPNNKWFIFLNVKKHQNDFQLEGKFPAPLNFLKGKQVSRILEASYLGAAEALAKNHRPNATLEIPAISAETLGALIILFEFQVALLGLLYKVDAFNQPGVEESKKRTKRILFSI